MLAPSVAAACSRIDVGVDRDAACAFGYDAVTPEGKRRPATGLLRSEDDELRPLERRRLLSQARDVHRNFVAAAWMIRRHLDYVSSFSFQAKTGSDEVNELVERKVRGWSRPENWDVARRHGRDMFTRLLEARAVIDGDCGYQRLRDGRVQAIEGDRVCTPTGGLPAGLNPADFLHGVQLDQHGGALAYCVCKRRKASDFAPGGADFQFERLVDARHMDLHGYFDRFDQVRGISPLAPAINSMVDLYEGIDYALVRMKIDQLFTLAVYRGDPSSFQGFEDGRTDYTKLQLGKRPFILDLDPNDRAEFLESSNPSQQFQSFTQLLIQLVLKALDIPFSFFSENFSNYSGSRQALLMYEQSADIKRQNLRRMLDTLTAWRLRLWMVAGELPPIPEDQMRWEWVSTGIPWIDPLKEVNADIAAVGAGLDSRTNLLKQRGRDIHDVVRELSDEKKLFEAAGLPVAVTPDNALVRELAAHAA
jgi:capsid protein